MKFETKAIHAGQGFEALTGAVIVPIFQTSTYAQESPGTPIGKYEYSRHDNPTRKALEDCIAALEEAEFGLAFSSGMTAINTVMNLLKSGDHCIVSEDVYGGTYNLFDKLYKKYDISFSFLDTGNVDKVLEAIKPNTRLIFVETPSNPLLELTDIRMVADIAHANDIILAIDNTFMSPYFQKPITLGADIVIHSTTKYIGGHSDVIGGAIATSNHDLYDKLKFFQKTVGGVSAPMESFLVLRGLKTLAVRMREHEQNARLIADFLESELHAGKKKITKVYYPGLKSHPQHDLAKRQMDGFGGIVSLEINGGLDEVKRFFKGLKIFTLAPSLGGVESLIAHPATMTHASIPPWIRNAIGITDSFIRISVGIEHPEDLINDLRCGLAGV